MPNQAIVQWSWQEAGFAGILILLLLFAIVVLWRYLTKLIKSHKKECWKFAEEVKEDRRASTAVMTELCTLIKTIVVKGGG